MGSRLYLLWSAFLAFFLLQRWLKFFPCLGIGSFAKKLLHGLVMFFLYKDTLKSSWLQLTLYEPSMSLPYLRHWTLRSLVPPRGFPWVWQYRRRSWHLNTISSFPWLLPQIYLSAPIAVYGPRQRHTFPTLPRAAHFAKWLAHPWRLAAIPHTSWRLLSRRG